MKISVFGSGLDSLLCSHQLILDGHNVEHFTGGNRVAGHFAGAITDHGRFDMGMVLLEKDIRSTPQNKLEHFNGEFGVNARSFLGESYQYIEEHFGPIKPRPTMTHFESVGEINDYFIADSLDFLDLLNNVEKTDLKSRLISLLSGETPNFVHPSTKNNTSKMLDDRLTVQLELFYGRELASKLFGNFVEGLTGAASTEIPLRFHRKLWLPLYYPETILSKLLDSKKSIDQLTFYEFQTESLATKIGRLMESLLRNNLYKLSQVKYEELDNSLDSTQVIFLLNAFEINRLIKSDTIQTLTDKISKNVFQSETNQVNILHLCIDKVKNKTVFLQSPVSKLFRYSISNGINDDTSSLSAEFGNLTRDSITDLVDIVTDVEQNLKVKCKGQVFKMNFATRHLNMTLEEWNQQTKLIELELSKYSKNIIVVHPDASSFNDNLVRGLAAAKKMGDLL